MKQELTPKQEKFCLAVVSGKNYSDAYREAGYSTSNMKTNTINRAAFAVLENPKVSTRIKELKEKLHKKLEYTAVESFENLKKILAEAISKGQLSAAIKAEELCGKLAGLYVEKLAHTDSTGKDIELPLVNNEELLDIMERRRNERRTEGTSSD